MPRTRPPYPVEFRRQMVELVRAGRDPTDLAREFEPSAQAIRNWVAEADQFIERLFGHLKNWRRVATRYDRLSCNYLAAVALVSCVVAWT